MACDIISLYSWGLDGNFICFRPVTVFVDYYIDGGPTVIGTKIYSARPCIADNNASRGYYSYLDGTTTKWFFAEKNSITNATEITLTGECKNCAIGQVTSFSDISYFDCCGNFITLKATVIGQTFEYDPTRPYTGSFSFLATTLGLCPSSTPTPTPSITPPVTPTMTQTPTQTPTNTITPTPSITPSNSPVVRKQNECIPQVVFPMGISCRVIQQPTSQSLSNGTLEIQITGGTSPYSIFWQNGGRNSIINNLPGGSYPVTVVDFYGDYTASTVCTLIQPEPNCKLVGTAVKV